MLVRYIRKYVIILGGIFPLTSPNQNIGGCVPGIPGGVDASESYKLERGCLVSRTLYAWPTHC